MRCCNQIPNWDHTNLMKTKKITFSEALNSALSQAMELDDKVFAFGLGVGTTSEIFGTTKEASLNFGPKRVFDGPVSEQALTQLAAGAALGGLRPVLIHQRFDFMLYSLDAIFNWISLWHFKSAGKSSLPMVIRAIVGKGWGQGPQHSKNMLSMFSHCPGLRVVIPSNPFEAKGLLISSIFSNDPVLFIDERSLHSMAEEVPNEPYFIDMNTNYFAKTGADLTIVTYGSGLKLSVEVSNLLENLHGIDAEIISLRSVAPLFLEDVYESVKKTGHLVVIENSWPVCGIGSEIISSTTEFAFDSLVTKPIKISWPNSHIPMSSLAEEEFYPKATDITRKILKILKKIDK